LVKFGVKLLSLKRNKVFTKDTLVLVYLYKYFRKPVTKEELTDFLANYGDRSNDVQQARHLGQQKGWYIISGQRKDNQCQIYGVTPGKYSLISLEEPYPRFTRLRRGLDINEESWESIKEDYNYRCATCGSVENELNLQYPNVLTTLQKGHMDPKKPLTMDNIIPQCSECNRQDRNNFVYNKKSRVIKISDPKFILRSDNETKKEMLELLKDELEK